MSRHTTYRCDIPNCGKEHTANNGFYLLKRDGKWLLIGAWSENEELDRFEHYCSAECLFRRIEQVRGKEMHQ